MSDEEKDIDNTLEGIESQLDNPEESTSTYKTSVTDSGDTKLHLSGMYRNWFLEYASYVILERAVPHLADGLKPVQRRILHAMRLLEDGRYNKVANVIGSTMAYHPHGDASIGDALVQLGQKDLLIDYQGNWGNILTGDSAAAPRYIEARLSKFALEVVYSPKVTEWQLSYDGRKKEPITLPVKFPLLLAQGVEGIAVGLSSKILPHNYNELLDAAIAYLRGEDFRLYPDFRTGGYIDVSRYNDGERGGAVKVRAKIDKIDNRTLAITEIPYGKTTSTLIESILKAQEKGKIKIRKVDDNTAAQAEILIHLPAGVSSDKTIDALYAFTDCEVSISPNCCVIDEKKPHFLSVSEVLRRSVNRTRDLLRQELEIKLQELHEALMFASLEKIFIEERIYKDREFEESRSMDEAVAHIDKRLTPFKPQFIREITTDDILRLMEIKMARILRFNSEKAENYIAEKLEQIAETRHHLSTLTEYTIAWYTHLKETYGKNFPRMTEIRSFDTIEATKVVEATEKLYINKEDGFMGTGLQRDPNAEFVCNCSNIDDIIIFYKDGRYTVVKVAEKQFIGKNILHIDVFKRNDNRTIYNVIYMNGKGGVHYMKRFAVTGITRDKMYDLTQGKPGSRVKWFTANSNGEAETVKVVLEKTIRSNKDHVMVDFSTLAIKGRASMGNIVTKGIVRSMSLAAKGGSTLGGRDVWFDRDVLRLNYDKRGEYLGEFHNNDLVLVVLDNGDFYTTNFDATNHYEANILLIEKFDANRIWTVLLNDANQQGLPYIKRFKIEASARKQNFLGDNEASKMIMFSRNTYPRFEVKLGGGDAFREPIIIDAHEFIAIKGFSAKGKRITQFTIESITELEPTRQDEPVEDDSTEEQPPIDGQLSIFPTDEIE
ncbi:MAG: DNA gyrase/topoisomerase IV subunit A [Bacteroidaceae bacterium]|nr:DNA gyrase/topoisomerase IV subunit A [Bacteroidaceae bacterium]